MTDHQSSTSAPVPWNERVAEYADDLQALVDELTDCLDETRVSTRGLQTAEVEAQTARLSDGVLRLETMVVARQDLLAADDAPTAGLSLSEKLLSTRRIEDARLARRCGALSEAIDQTHRRAMALFVCQHHLADAQTETLRRLAGAAGPRTYDNPAAGQKRADPRSARGGLFNDAA